MNPVGPRVVRRSNAAANAERFTSAQYTSLAAKMWTTTNKSAAEAVYADRNDLMIKQQLRIGSTMHTTIAGAEATVAIGVGRLGGTARRVGVVGDVQIRLIGFVRSQRSRSTTSTPSTRLEMTIHQPSRLETRTTSPAFSQSAAIRPRAPTPA